MKLSKQLTALALAAVLLLSALPVSAAAQDTDARYEGYEETSGEIPMTPQAEDTDPPAEKTLPASTGTGYFHTSHDNKRIAIYGETVGADPVSSFRVELYIGDTKLATTVLNDYEGIYAAATDSLTWHFHFRGETDPYWTTTVHASYDTLTAERAPTKVIAYVDGTAVAASPVTVQGESVFDTWLDMVAELNPGVKIGSKGYASIQHAIDKGASGSALELQRNLTEGDITIPSGKRFTIDLKGKTVTGSFLVEGAAVIQNGTILNTNAGKSAIESNGASAKLTVEALTITSARHALRIDGGEAVILGGSYTTNGTGTIHAVNIGNSSGSPATTVTISGGTFTGAAGQDSTAVNIQSGSTVSISGGTFQSGGTGTLGLWGGHVDITGGSFYASAEADILNIQGSATSQITGGQYNKDPEAFIKRGLAAQYNTGTKLYTIVPAVAEIGTKGYADLAAAFADADPSSSDTIGLLSPITSAAITLDTAIQPKKVTLDLAGKQLTGATITLTNPLSRLTIQDSAATPGTGSHITLAGPTANTGHTLKWNTDAVQSTAVPVITTATGATYSFSWVANRYTVSFQGNGGTADTPMEDQAFTYGSAQNLSANTFTRTGYSFAGWNTKADGSGTSYADQAEVENLTADSESVTLYAQWRANTYKIVYDGNTATDGSMEETGNIAYGSYVSLRANSFAKSGYNFAGWAETPDGPAKYADNAQVLNLTTVNGGTVTLYAVWVPKTLDIISPSLKPQTYYYDGKLQHFETDSRLTVRYEPVTSDSTRVNVGTYNVILSAPATADHAAYPETVIPNGLVISPRILTATYAGETIYAGQSPSLKVTVTGFAEGENDTTHKPAGYTAPTIASPGGAIGTYTLTPSGGKADNYIFTYVPGKLTIREKVIYVYDPDNLLQTGQLTWPIPVMTLLGLAAVAVGAWLLKKKERHGR